MHYLSELMAESDEALRLLAWGLRAWGRRASTASNAGRPASPDAAWALPGDERQMRWLTKEIKRLIMEDQRRGIGLA